MEKKHTLKKPRQFSFIFSFQNIVFLSIVVCVIGYMGYLQGFRSGVYMGFLKGVKQSESPKPRMAGCTKELKICPDGTSVGRSGPYCEFDACPNISISTTPGSSSCMVGGCSGQLCGEETEINSMMTTCEYKEEYACYKLSTCERQADGKCGWSYNPEFNKCMFNAQANPEGPKRQ